jgi:hypothetical protein
MKIHVPANFVGYGTFALAAMVGVAYLCKSHGILADRLPALELLDDVMYKAIAVGFAFFTIATILGGLWAAEAWGGYWSWDPKETWALIVWLNYAAWPARTDRRLVGIDRLAGHHIRLPGCQHVPVGPAFLRPALSLIEDEPAPDVRAGFGVLFSS